MRKRITSLFLALALCMGLAAPAMAAKETTVSDPDGNVYTLSQPAVSMGEQSLSVFMGVLRTMEITVYAVPEGTELSFTWPGGLSSDLLMRTGDTWETLGYWAGIKGTAAKTTLSSRQTYYTGTEEDEGEGNQQAITEDLGDRYMQIFYNSATGKGIGFVIAQEPPVAPIFTDVPAGAYYAEPVKWAVEKGITNGTSAATFSPNQTCTRAQIITFLWRAAGSPEPQSASAFTDVKADAYYTKAAAWAAENGMADGDTFSPDAPCTRLMAVEFMWKQAGSPSVDKADFTDVSSAAVNWAVKNGVTNGTSATTFSPDSTCTRAQIVTFLYRAFAE